MWEPVGSHAASSRRHLWKAASRRRYEAAHRDPDLYRARARTASAPTAPGRAPIVVGAGSARALTVSPLPTRGAFLLSDTQASAAELRPQTPGWDEERAYRVTPPSLLQFRKRGTHHRGRLATSFSSEQE